MSLAMPDDGKPVRRTAILDAAEAQFAQHGYDGVNLRAIARDAGVDVALANYHFGKKRDLFDAVLMRRAEVLNAWRLKALEDALSEARPNPPSVEAIVRAYLRRLSLGDVDEKALYWSYHCFSGALTLTFAETGRIDLLSKGLCRSDDLVGAYEHVVRFITAGFESIRPA